MAVSIRNYRRLKDVTIELDETAAIFVGADNSGKTFATHVLKSFLGRHNDREPFSIHDFSAECWNTFNAVEPEADSSRALPSLPVISLDLRFEIGDKDLVHVRDLLPSLDWDRQPIGVRLEYAPVDTAALLDQFRKACPQARNRSQGARRDTTGDSPWPSSLFEYLRRRLRDEYKIYYYVLDRAEFDDEWQVAGALPLSTHPRHQYGQRTNTVGLVPGNCCLRRGSGAQSPSRSTTARTRSLVRDATFPPPL